ncbi:hypothetical protein [Nodosilinea nodulosa]|uniref:hypothetical protein n=1 Tax=Nodosilinea nodulosa TaxID=416001 RepID=UPI0012D7E8AF|nr:hypothetical protein [Nodosilinea nodulosa]
MARSVNDEKDALFKTLDHISTIIEKTALVTGRGKAMSFADSHKIMEGLFLSAWTHWEEFLRDILVIDLATDTHGFLRKDIRKFRVKGAPFRYAEKLLNHPDAPKSWVEWNYDQVYKRAEDFLSNGHRYPRKLPRHDDIQKLKRIRNGIAHHSDNAWDSFKKLVKEDPFYLAPTQLRGLTVGRFLVSNQWNGKTVIKEAIDIIRNSSNALVP